MKPCSPILSGLVGGILLSGCAGPSSGVRTGAASDTADAVARPSVERPPLKIGMAAEEVRSLWGAPEAVTPVKDPAMNVELWIYPGRLRVETKPVAATVSRVMSFNPTTESGMIEAADPVYTIETRRFEEKLQVVMIDGRVADLLRESHELPATTN